MRNDLLSPAKAAAYLGVPVRTIRYLLDRGMVPFERVGTAGRPMRRIRRRDLERRCVRQEAMT